ncbi:MAG: hypothetical protein V3V04_01900 [Rhizobiaceae bacterium]
MNYDPNKVYIKATLVLVDGTKLEGEVILAQGGVLERTLNNSDAKVIVFRDESSERFITKSYIVEAIEQKS